MHHTVLIEIGQRCRTESHRRALSDHCPTRGVNCRRTRPPTAVKRAKMDRESIRVPAASDPIPDCHQARERLQ